MQLKGTVSVVLGESRLNGRLLAIQGDPNPFGAATDFLANRNIFNKSRATIDGNDGFVGTVPVFFITSAMAGFAQSLALNLMESGARLAKKAGAKKSARKSAKKSAKKAGAKKSAKKAGAKKSAAKKAAKKTSRKGAQR